MLPVERDKIEPAAAYVDLRHMGPAHQVPCYLVRRRNFSDGMVLKLVCR